MTYRRIRQGERFIPSASGWNAAMEAAEAYQRDRQTLAVGSVADSRSQLIYIRNDSGADREQFDILGVNGTVISPAENENEFSANPYLVGVNPAARHIGNFAILQEPIPAGKFGRALVAGWSHVRIKPGSGSFAEIIAGDATQLQQGSSGSAQILYAPTTDAAGEAGLGLIRFGAGTGLVTTQPGGTDVWGCHPWDCTSDAASFQAVSCGACATTPDFFVFHMPLSCTCCDGRAASPDSDRPGEVVLQRTVGNNCVYESAPFSCRAGGGTCGTARWKWQNTGTYCSIVVYRTRLKASSYGCGWVTYVWDNVTHTWNITGGTGVCNTVDCATATPPPYPGVNNGDYVIRYCGSWEWYNTGEGVCSPGCTDPGPPARPATEGDLEYVYCTGTSHGTGYAWVPIDSACVCGTSQPPSVEGDYDGQIVSVPCSGVGSGYDTASHWKLTLGASPHVDLVGPDSGIILRYDLKAGRTMCCECANVFEFSGPCGPFDCESFPDTICVKPYWPPKDCTACPAMPAEYAMTIAFFADHSDGNYNFHPANGTFSLSKIREDASGAIYHSPTFSMNYGATVKTCYWEARVNCLFGFTTGSVALIGYSEDLGGFAKAVWGGGNMNATGGHVTFYWAGPSAYDATNGPCRGGRYCSLDTTPQAFELPLKNISISDNFFSGGGQTRTACGTTRDLFSGSDDPFFTTGAPRITLTPV